MEIHIFSSDGQTRLGYFVHVFIDPSAEMLPRSVNDCEDDSSILLGAVNQETDKGEKNVDKNCFTIHLVVARKHGHFHCCIIVSTFYFVTLWFTLIFYCSGNRAAKETRVKCKEQMHRQRDVVRHL